MFDSRVMTTLKIMMAARGKCCCGCNKISPLDLINLNKFCPHQVLLGRMPICDRIIPVPVKRTLNKISEYRLQYHIEFSTQNRAPDIFTRTQSKTQIGGFTNVSVLHCAAN